jgi:hypothetical protein
MKLLTSKISRRKFLRFFSVAAGFALVNPKLSTRQFSRSLNQAENWPSDTPLGRNCLQGPINLRSSPNENGSIVKQLERDAVVVWEKEVVGGAPGGLLSRRWVQSPGGYVYAPYVQPCRSIFNSTVNSLPNNSAVVGVGRWAEVTVPYVDLSLENPPARSPWVQAVPNARLYYKQVVWIDQTRDAGNGITQYRVNERFAYGDIFWADGRAFRLLTDDDFIPISPEVTDKKIIVNLTQQFLQCMEGNREVYYCRCSTGAKFNAAGQAVDKWATPPGPHPINRKMASMHMSGGNMESGYDTPGIGWVSLFADGGVSVHSTFWHNDFGVPRSHGCVNVLPDDAKWVFRWTTPLVPYDPGDVTVSMPGGTIVDVVESI